MMRKLVVALTLLFVANESVTCCGQTVLGNSGSSPVATAVFPATPTTEDEVLFTLAADEIVHGNPCEQLRAFGGADFSLVVNEISRTIEIGVSGTHGGFCSREFAPVNGVRGSFGPLSAGEWEVQATFGNPGATFGETFSFTVVPTAVPEPSGMGLGLIAASCLLRRRQRRV